MFASLTSNSISLIISLYHMYMCDFLSVETRVTEIKHDGPAASRIFGESRSEETVALES